MTTTLAAPVLTFDSSCEDWSNDDWTWPVKAPLARSGSTKSYGVTVMGRGFDWQKRGEEEKEEDVARTPVQKEVPSLSPPTRSPARSPVEPDRPRRPSPALFHSTPNIPRRSIGSMIAPPAQPRAVVATNVWSPEPFARSPLASPLSSRPHSPASGSPALSRTPFSRSPNISRPGTPRARRRSSQQRVSLIAGRVVVLPNDPPAHPEVPQRLVRSGSARSFLSVAASVGPPTPGNERDEPLNERNIYEFVVEKEIGRGAYGLVKRAREMDDNGKLGPPLVIKQIIKTRILADCWKRHPKHGTIPIEIYVLNAISSTSYVLPPRRPWDAQRALPADVPRGDDWVEGKVVKGHPNICPMLDFFEDDQYYYMVMPFTTAEPVADEPAPPSDLFDLVESYPQGLPPDMARSYLGQIADAMAFLHSKGIVHRDIKDENVVLGKNGKAILIDFGSSGLVRKSGWDTFSGTLDYAGPEILRGERYHGKEQDVWAFGVVAFVLLVGECPFTTAAEAQDGLDSPFCNARIALDERCGDGHEREGEEADGGAALGDAAELVRRCLQVDLTARPTFDRILESRFLMGRGGWAEEA